MRVKHGGRVKGTPNKKTRALEEICEAKGLNVFEAMIELYKSCDKVEVQFNCLKELAQYLYAKRKAVEISGENPFADKTLDELKKLALEKLK